jgi:hemerythrin-like domain-containing protein
MKQKPIKRSEYVVALSKDHHASLLFCWKIKEGLKKNIPLEKVLKYINFFWSRHLIEHFREEEALLFNRIDDDMSRRGKLEHLMLERRVNHLNQRRDEAKGYFEFADFLTKHIRFEERELFPHLETTFSGAMLKQVGEYLASQHAVDFTDDYPDEFWSKNYKPQ